MRAISYRNMNYQHDTNYTITYDPEMSQQYGALPHLPSIRGRESARPRLTAAEKRRSPAGTMSCGGTLFQKKGGDLLSHIAVQYHRRARA